MSQSHEKRRIFLDIRTNPARVVLNSDAPGDAIQVTIVMVNIDISLYENGLNYVQIDFGDAAHKEATQVYGALASCYQLAINGIKTKTPLHLRGDRIPQNFSVTIYEPGEPASLMNIGPNGCQIWFEYEFIPK